MRIPAGEINFFYGKDAAGDVLLRLKKPYSDGTSHLVFSPLEFLEKLAALVAQGRDGPPCSILLPFPINGEL